MTTAQAPEVTVSVDRRPALISGLNGFGRVMGDKITGSLIHFDPERLIAKARRATGLSDFGGERFREGLEVLCRSLEEDAQLSLQGRIFMQQTVMRSLTNRLEIQKALTDHPEIRQEQVRRPLIIIGLPRTGSTLLQRLLARDPNARSLATWEMMWPAPPPTTETYTTDPRIAQADRRMKLLNWMAPDFAPVHEWTAGEPEEGVGLLQNSFQTITYNMMAEVSSYGEWLKTQDRRPPYDEFVEQLKLLQWRCPGSHWVLKSPVHLFSLEAVLDAIPDACIIQTHRRAQKVLPSVCGYFAVLHKMASDKTELTRMGPYWLDQWAKATDEAMALRDRIGDDRFIDIDFRTLASDPVATAKTIYEHFDMPWSEEASEAMAGWFKNNRRHKHGVHTYTLEQYGLTDEAVEARFGEYHRRHIKD